MTESQFVFDEAGATWVYCPVCGNKTRIKLRKDTVLRNFPLHCPKCRNNLIINAENLQVGVIDRSP